MLTIKTEPAMIMAVARARRPAPVALEAVVAAWLEHYPSAHTRDAYRADLEHFARWSRAERVNPLALDETDLQRYRAACEADGSGPSSVARRLSAISSFGAFSLAQGTSRATPRIDRPPLPASSTTESLGDEDASAMLAAADQMDVRTALLVRLLMLDGLKVGQAVQADVTDVSGRPPRMTLTLKAPSRRVIRLNPATGDLLAVYLGRRRRGPLLLSEHRARVADRLTRFGVDYVVKQAAEAARVSVPVSANTLRRRFLVAAHERGDDLEVIRDSAGHADARTTRRYLTAANTDRRGPELRSRA